MGLQQKIAIFPQLWYNIGNYKRKYALLPETGIGMEIMVKNMKKLTICMISSSGGHYEQLRMLRALGEKHDLFWVTEKTDYKANADFYLKATGSNDPLFPFKMLGNCFKTLGFWLKKRPDVVITTGAFIAVPACKAAGQKSDLHRILCPGYRR